MKKTYLTILILALIAPHTAFGMERDDVNAVDKDGNFPLLLASQKGTPDVVELLLNNGALPTINWQCASGRTPLHQAAEKGSCPGLCSLLLRHKADPNIQDNNGATPLHVACQNGNGLIARDLLTHNAHLEIRDNHGRPPLFIACHYKQLDSLQELLCAHHQADADRLTRAVIYFMRNTFPKELSSLIASYAHMPIYSEKIYVRKRLSEFTPCWDWDFGHHAFRALVDS